MLLCRDLYRCEGTSAGLTKDSNYVAPKMACYLQLRGVAQVVAL